jgi:protein-tyrosine phosphatase
MKQVMKRILFVCLGNICRSPTAEAVFRDRVSAAGRESEIEIDSAGTIAAHAGEPADARMRQHASARGYTLSSISRKVVKEDFTRFTHIIAMDRQNLQDLRDMAPPGSTAQLSLLLEADPASPTPDVPDPYYGGAEGFETVLDLIESASEHLLASLE